MIPVFPQFAAYSFDFNEEVMLTTASMPQHTEASMAAMFSWDHNEHLAMSQLFGNIVITINQDNPGVLTILGSSHIDATIEAIFAHCSLKGFDRKLHLIPEPTVQAIKQCKDYTAQLDADHHDYVIDLVALTALEGSPMRNIRRKVRACLNKHGHMEYVTLNLADRKTISELDTIHTEWMHRAPERSTLQEYKAEKKLIKHHTKFNIVARGIIKNGRLIAYIILERNKPWLHGHFWKANRAYSGLYHYLMHKCATEFLSCGYTFMNIQDDMGMYGLRTFKQRFNPTILRKYTITHAGHQQILAEEFPSQK